MRRRPPHPRTAFTLIGLSALLCACTTTAKSPDADLAAVTPTIQTATNGLGAQSLNPGECGLFGWDTTTERDFVFFATADRALYRAQPDATETLLPNGLFPAEDYGPYQLRLGAREPLIDGTRYPAARMTEMLPDGFTRVRPLVVLQTCQTPRAANN